MNKENKQPVRVSEWEIQASRLVEQQAEVQCKGGKITLDGRTYVVDKPDSAPVFRNGTVADLRQYEEAVSQLVALREDASSEERKALERKIQRKREKLQFSKKRRPRETYVPGHLKPDYRAFETWLVKELESMLSKNSAEMNFGFWCAAESDVGRIDLNRLGFSKGMIDDMKAANMPGTSHQPKFSPEEFLSAATGIHLDRIQKAFEILNRDPKPAELVKLQGEAEYLSNEELDRCVDACRGWCGYQEPGIDQAATVVRVLFEEMNRRGIDKHELSKRARVAVNTLDSWNNKNAAKRKPPSLPKITACLEAMGLHLLVVPEAEVLEFKRLLAELEDRKNWLSGEVGAKKPENLL